MEALQTVCDLQYPFRQILRNDPLDLHKAARTASHCSSVDCHNTLRCFPVDFRSRMASPVLSRPQADTAAIEIAHVQEYYDSLKQASSIILALNVAVAAPRTPIGVIPSFP